MVHEGRFVTGDNYFVELPIPANKQRTFTVLVCHREAHIAFPFSFRLMAPFQIKKFARIPEERWEEKEMARGQWESQKQVTKPSLFTLSSKYLE